MTTVFISTLALMAAMMAAMAVGVIFSGRRLRGSCGGSGADDCWCEKRQIDPSSCPGKK